MTLLVPVERTWSGEPAEAGEGALLVLAPARKHLRIVVDAPFHGDAPPPGPPGPTPGLWEHEVVELFVAGPGSEDVLDYLEIELSPHGHHLVLRLRGLRRPVEQGLPLDFRAAIDGPRWRGEALVPRAWLPPPPHRAAAFAIHGTGAARRYLSSVALPGDRPDFHQPRSFPPVEL